MLPSVHVNRQHVTKDMSNDNTTTVAVNGTSHGNSNNSNNSNSIAVSDMKDGELLKEVLELVLKEKLVTGMDTKAKVVQFKQPQELQEVLDLSVCNDESSVQEAKLILRQVLDYSVKTQHPHFYNQLYGGIDEVALTGAWITEALNTNQYTFEVAPVFIMVEHKVISYLLDLFGFTQGDGIFAPGGSISNMYGMVLARYLHQPDIKRKGIFAQKPLVAFTSDQGHYSVSKSAAWLGLGMDNVVAVPSDEQGRMLPKALKEAVEEARNRGHTPFFVNATSGTTVLGTYDPLEELADVCSEEGLWLHVDACWGGSVIVSKKYNSLLKGIERADSLSWNPHKMLGLSLQCSTFLTRHKGLLHECNSARATYLFQQDKYYDASYDTGDKSIQCGRKVDAFKLWFYLKVHGIGQLRSRVDLAFEASRYLAEQVVSKEGFRLVQQPECTNVCFWYIPPSMRGQPETSEWWGRIAKVAPEIKARMVKEGRMMIGYQPLACKNLVNFFRMVTTCTPVPTSTHMDQVLNTIDTLGTDL
ncbi:hypothetical protein Pcinc_022013 [Petrolisthes cinctipes]|uniref:Cysteine sulfinic acid decarboxylase n=1 Tax=Petrolisthes cinctipes TaxID=88211 RepID=A0AAE1KGM6_PETCI|nr:hypothetical protein Pcinc_022013 [Petrolisthes cinctipes]